MKFFNTVTSVELIDTDYVILDNSQSEQAAIVITLQLINNSATQITVVFGKLQYNNQQKQWQPTAYVSTINIKSGTTIMDHIVVINAKQKYVVSSNSNDLIVSCSYGI